MKGQVVTNKLYFVGSGADPKKYVHDPRGKLGTGIFWEDRAEAEQYCYSLNEPYGKDVYKVFMWKGAAQQL